MSASGGIIADLIAEGVSPDLIERVADALADARAAVRALESRRKTDRDRKARSREVTGSHVTGRDSRDPSPNDNISNPLPVSSEPDGSTETPTTPKKLNGEKQPEISPEQVIEAWNVMAEGAGVPKAKLTDERRRKLRTFVRRHTTDDITEAIWAVPRSPFLCGENDRGWKAGIDFILQPSSFTKLIEGTYDRSTH